MDDASHMCSGLLPAHSGPWGMHGCCSQGNVALGIFLTVATNVVGVVIIPLWLKATLSAGVQGVDGARGRARVGTPRAPDPVQPPSHLADETVNRPSSPPPAPPPPPRPGLAADLNISYLDIFVKLLLSFFVPTVIGKVCATVCVLLGTYAPCGRGRHACIGCSAAPPLCCREVGLLPASQCSGLVHARVRTAAPPRRCAVQLVREYVPGVLPLTREYKVTLSIISNTNLALLIWQTISGAQEQIVNTSFGERPQTRGPPARRR